jgi:hypothetical protein
MQQPKFASFFKKKDFVHCFCLGVSNAKTVYSMSAGTSGGDCPSQSRRTRRGAGTHARATN